MHEVFSFNYFGSIIEARSLGTSFIPELRETLTSHCIPFTEDDQIVAVNIVGRGVDIPGGHIDQGETAIEAMTREAYEEAQIGVESPVLIDVWKLTSEDEHLGLSKKPFLLLYAAKVTSMENFTPNNEANKRLVFEPKDFIRAYFGNKQQARVMVEKALSALR